jgi:hypothetical protein
LLVRAGFPAIISVPKTYSEPCVVFCLIIVRLETNFLVERNEAEASEQVCVDAPIDDSGRHARAGYHYQDLCALRYLLRAAAAQDWDEVWCESHDDIVLSSDDGSYRRYRFTQVKFKLGATQHWSCAKLLDVRDAPSAVRRTPTALDYCVLCKLFNGARSDSNCEFRLAVNEGVNEELRPFRYRWGDAEPSIDTNCDGAIALLERLRIYLRLANRW